MSDIFIYRFSFKDELYTFNSQYNLYTTTKSCTFLMRLMLDEHSVTVSQRTPNYQKARGMPDPGGGGRSLSFGRLTKCVQ
jgi:hypothetical protein